MQGGAVKRLGSGRHPVNPEPQSQPVRGYGGHLVALLQYGVALCPCVSYRRGRMTVMEERASAGPPRTLA